MHLGNDYQGYRARMAGPATCIFIIKMVQTFYLIQFRELLQYQVLPIPVGYSPLFMSQSFTYTQLK